MSLSGGASSLGGAVQGFVLGPILAFIATSSRHVNAKMLLIGALMVIVAIWALSEWLYLRTVVLSMHERGLRFVSKRSTEVSFVWSEVTGLEASYTPGFTKRGTADEANCLRLVVMATEGRAVSVPRELTDFQKLLQEIPRRSEKVATKVLIQATKR